MEQTAVVPKLLCVHSALLRIYAQIHPRCLASMRRLAKMRLSKGFAAGVPPRQDLLRSQRSSLDLGLEAFCSGQGLGSKDIDLFLRNFKFLSDSLDLTEFRER